MPQYESRTGELLFLLNYIPTFFFFTCYYIILGYWYTQIYFISNSIIVSTLAQRIEAYHGRRARTEPMAVRSRASVILGIISVVSLCIFIAFEIADVIVGDDPDNPSKSSRLLHKIFVSVWNACADNTVS